MAQLGAILWTAFGSTNATESGVRAVSQTMALAFLFMGILGTRIGSVLESQADEITDLKRRLRESHAAGAQA